MSKRNEQILNAIRNMVSSDQATIIGTVVSVDQAAQTAEIKLDDAGNVTDTIRLKSVVDNAEAGFVLFPAVGSVILASRILSGEDFFMVSASEVDEVWLNGKANEGLINISELTAKLNSLVDEVNALKDAYNSHIHTTTATVGGSTTPGVISSTTSTAQPASTFSKSDYEDETVKH